MKQILLILLLTTAFITAQAQNRNSDQQVKETYFYLQNGTLMINDWGHVVHAKREMTIRDNTKITITGFVVYSDGKTYQLKEWESIDQNGKIDKAPDAKATSPAGNDRIQLEPLSEKEYQELQKQEQFHSKD